MGPRAHGPLLVRWSRRFRWSIEDIAALAGTGPLEQLAVTFPTPFTSHAARHVRHIDANGRSQPHDYTAEPFYGRRPAAGSACAAC